MLHFSHENGVKQNSLENLALVLFTFKCWSFEEITLLYLGKYDISEIRLLW